MLRTGRRGFETTCSPSSASIAVSGRNVAVIVTDNIAPSVPAGLTATVISSSQINLSWSASTDTGGSGLAGYRVYRNGSGTPLVQQSGTTYSDTGLTASTLYAYRVSAYDNQGNESTLSSQASATTSSASGQTDTSQILHFQNFSAGTIGARADSFSGFSDGPGTVLLDPLGSGRKCIHDHFLAHSANTFGFGSTYSLGTHHLTSGDEFWGSVKILMPVGSDHSANSSTLKWLRLRNTNAAGVDVSLNNLYLHNDNTMRTIFEGEDIWSDQRTSAADGPVYGQWATWDWHIVFGAVARNNGGLAFQEVWKDGERILSVPDRATLDNATDYGKVFYLWTYFNSGGVYPTANQDWYWTDHAIAVKCAATGRDDSPYLSTDSGGRKRIGVLS